MSTYEDVSVVGRAKFLETRLPTASEVGAKVRDRFVDTTTGVIYSCVADTFGSQQWLGVDGSIIPAAILATDHPDLVAMYTMDNIIGSSLEDESLNNNDGAITGATTVTGQLGSALTFDGVDDFVDLGFTGSTLSQGAVSVWADTISNKTLISRSDASSANNILALQQGATERVRITSINSSGSVANQVDALGAIPVGINHLVYQSNGVEWSIYINGVLQTLTTVIGVNDGGWFAGFGVDNIKLGGFFSNNPDFSISTQDQLRFFNRALTQEEITTLYNEGNQ